GTARSLSRPAGLFPKILEKTSKRPKLDTNTAFPWTRSRSVTSGCGCFGPLETQTTAGGEIWPSTDKFNNETHETLSNNSKSGAARRVFGLPETGRGVPGIHKGRNHCVRAPGRLGKSIFRKQTDQNNLAAGTGSQRDPRNHLLE